MIDRQRLNFAHNDLKNLAGERGAFILFIATGEGEGHDVQMRFVGPDLKVLGLLESCGRFVRERMNKQFDERITKLPTEPD